MDVTLFPPELRGPSGSLKGGRNDDKNIGRSIGACSTKVQQSENMGLFSDASL